MALLSCSKLQYGTLVGARVVCVFWRGWGLGLGLGLGPSGKLRAKFTCLTAKSTSPKLSGTTFFARCVRTSEMLFIVCCVYFSHKLIKPKKIKSLPEKNLS